jgi:hypothetical protein
MDLLSKGGYNPGIFLTFFPFGKKELIPVLPEQEDDTAQAERSYDGYLIEPGPGCVRGQRR